MPLESDSTFVTDWTAEQEQGRTEYLVRSADEVVVRDFVLVDGIMRLFGEAVYRRPATGGRRLEGRYR